MSEQKYINRPPRIQPEIPTKKVEIPAPPQKEDDTGSILMQVALPLVTVIGFVVVAAMGGQGGGSAFLILPMFLSVIATTAFAWYMHKRQEKLRQKQVAAYKERMLELRQEMISNHEAQRRFHHYNYPDTATVLRIAEDVHLSTEDQQASIRSGSRLWERRLTDEDFGFIRLGIGTIPSTTIYEFTRAENFEDELTREAVRLDEDSRFVSDTPVTIALRPFPKKEEGEEEKKTGDEELPPWSTPVTHATGIAGNPDDVYGFAWSVLAHYVTFHAATDTRLFILGPRRQPWEWAYALTHCQPDEQTDYLCFEDEASSEDQGADEETESIVNRFLENLRKILTQRELRLKDTEGSSGDNRDPRIPFLLVVIDLLDVIGEDSALSDLESDAAISILLQQGEALGASIIFLVPERSRVPSGCVSVIEIESVNIQDGGELAPYFRYAEVGVNTWRYIGRADTISSQDQIKEFAIKLEALDVRKSYGGALTTSVPFMEMVGESSMDGLRESTRHRWSKNLEPTSADWLKVKVGMMSGNKPRTLGFSAKRDGVHGMIAGSTGSGKSELLISMIVGLAINYDPSSLNFVLVDYKGGGAFQDFRHLPHCVDIITNLQGAGVVRMFTAINSELKRRQALNVRTGTKDIVEYRRRGYHLTDEPYPFLFIIIDEFAEMIAANPEFKTELETITRVGRAQGVSLILAAQRPSGVTDQMRSNIKFRICLRVEGTDESREMLRRNDAAYLPNNIPGRGYLQVGNDNIDSIQVAYTGDKYVDPTLRKRAKVIWPQRKRRATSEDKDAPKIYQAIVDMLDKLAEAQEVGEQQAPWPEILPANLSLPAELKQDKLDNIDAITLGQQLGSALSLNPAINRWMNGEPAWDGVNWDKYAMRPVVGLVDNPYEAKRVPLVIDLTRGHVVLFGAPGWGKTNFLRTLIVSLAATHSPRELSIFILDLGGRNLLSLRDFPHVGAVILPDEEGYEEQVQQLLRELAAIVEKRKKILGDEGIPHLYQYNKAHPDAPLPAILVALDNFIEFKESFEQKKDADEGMLEEFIALARESRAYGIHFAITISNLNALPNKMFNIFTERLTLKLSETADYRTITGASVPELEDIPGRGYIKAGRQALSFQVALPMDIKADDIGDPAREMRELRQLAATMKKESALVSDEMSLLRVEPIPRTVSYRQLMAKSYGLSVTDNFIEDLRVKTRENWQRSTTREHADWLAVNLGSMSGNRPRILQMAAPRDGVHGMIAGGTGSGKSELLMTMIVGLAVEYDPSILNFVLVDYKGGGAFKPFEGLPHVVDIITNLYVSGVVRMFTAINAELRRRQKLNADTSTKDIIDYRQKGLHLDPRWGPYPHLFIIIDEYAEMISAMPEFKAELDSITRVGRASGVNLILAAQRPTGVTDQMRSNIKFRICLRVEGTDESREMLRRPDAAYLPSGMPGRGYLQIGNEDIELIQVGFTGEKEPVKKEMPVIWEQRPSPNGSAAPEGDVPRLYDRVVTMSAELLAEIKDPARQPRRPWPGFLPGYLTLETLIKTDYLDPAEVNRMNLGRPSPSAEPVVSLNHWVTDWQNGETRWMGIDWKQYALRPVVGLVDNPANANQLPLVLNLTQSHYVLFGDSGWGKTTFLRTTIAGLAATHSPAELNFFVLDLGGRNFNVFKGLPHMADVIMPDDEAFEERVYRLVDRLNREVEHRQQILSATDSTDLVDYNSKGPDEPLPAILVVIDNFAGLNEGFEAMIENDLIPLARNGRAYGIHFIITANLPGAIPGKLNNLIGERLTLRMSDAAQYLDIVGRGAVELESIPGRGYIRMDRRPLEFQTALPVGLSVDRGNSTREAEALRLLIKKMDDAWTGARPPKILVLPRDVALSRVLGQAAEMDDSPRAIRAVLGLGANLKPAFFDIQQSGPHFIAVGPPLSGKTTVLRNWVLSLAQRYSPEQAPLILVDMQRKFIDYGGTRLLDELPHVLGAAADIDEFEKIVARLKVEYEFAQAERRPRRIFVLIDNFDDLNEELGSSAYSDLGKDAAHLARRFGTEGLHFIIAGALDSLSDLRRRIEANNYGIGLRTSDALEKLSVMRIPGSLRNTELAVGRGYTVKSGQISLIQVASPYQDMTGDPTAPDEGVNINDALDAWVYAIEAQYPGERAGWRSPEPDETQTEQPAEEMDGEAAGFAPAASRQVIALLRTALGNELRKQGLEPFELDDRAVIDMAQTFFGGEASDDKQDEDEDDELYDDEDLVLDLDFETEDILQAMEQVEEEE